MTHPSPPPRRLMRSRRDRYVGGVCGGLAQYLGLEVTLVRLLMVVLTVTLGGAPVLLYIIALFLMPEGDQGDPPQPPRTYPPVGPPSAASGPPSRSPYGSTTDPIWGTEGAPWEQQQPQPEPRPRPRPDNPWDRA